VSDINQIQERATLASQDEPPLADNARVLAWENAFAMAHEDRRTPLSIIDAIQALVSDWQSQPEELLERGYVCTELSNILAAPCHGGGG
jgi:hypothetical protein